MSEVDQLRTLVLAQQKELEQQRHELEDRLHVSFSYTCDTEMYDDGSFSLSLEEKSVQSRCDGSTEILGTNHRRYFYYFPNGRFYVIRLSDKSIVFSSEQNADVVRDCYSQLDRNVSQIPSVDVFDVLIRPHVHTCTTVRVCSQYEIVQRKHPYIPPYDRIRISLLRQSALECLLRELYRVQADRDAPFAAQLRDAALMFEINV